MIKTSYFARLKNSKKLQDMAVAICLYPPKCWKGEVYKKLAPTKKILEWWRACDQTPLDVGKYCRRYRKFVLDKLDVDEVAKDLDGKILCCFESTDKFCHRHEVAKWLRENGYDCTELLGRIE